MTDGAAVSVAELLPRLDRGDDLLLLDVRNDEEFGSWKLEGRRPVETVHVPYFDFIEEADASLARVPRGRELVVLCAKGGSSEMVVDMLKDAGIPARNVEGGMLAYGEMLVPVPVPTGTERFEIWQVNRRGKGCLSYVVRSGSEAIVVDPTRRIDWYVSFVASLGAKVVHVLDTHVHADHVSGGPALAAETGAPYFVAAGEGFELARQVTPLGPGGARRFGGEDGVTVRAIATPGHTPGSTSYLVGERHLLTGDTLFVSSVGRPDLGGHVREWGRELFETLRDRLASLDPETVVLPGHYGSVGEIGEDGVVSGTLGRILKTIPELASGAEDAFVGALAGAVKTPPEAYAEIVRVNLGASQPPAEKLTEWELGKNECAASRAHA